MKFDCGETYLEKRRRRQIKFLEKNKARMEWHDWFAWRPIRIGSHDCRWLEKIQRKLIAPYVEELWGYEINWYEYRLKEE